jgi:hypothetical protein
MPIIAARWISPLRALPIVGSYDAINNVLTLAQFSLPAGASDYVNSLWKLQDDPFGGDAVNSYNDGRLMENKWEDFMRLKVLHLQRHWPGSNNSSYASHNAFKGSKEDLNEIAKKLLGIGIDAIKL